MPDNDFFCRVSKTMDKISVTTMERSQTCGTTTTWLIDDLIKKMKEWDFYSINDESVVPFEIKGVKVSVIIKVKFQPKEG